MHKVSIFPDLLSYGELSPVLIRVVLGLVLVYWAVRASRKGAGDAQKKAVGLVEGIAGVLLLIGLYTQVAAVVAGIDLLIRLGERISKKSFLTDGVNYYLILLVLAVSLLVTGPGWWAFDYPL
ncbi:MAG: hypothetical protein QOG91_613 [Candidatus Parcubacteria bacterium]|jgi:uncharacterized membrane protein YphA (DoxX/SURF4 family)|nr:hypothetical protein [Candidatus Parcubacteria bacterium]